MELRHLRYFVAVAEELNFTRAARRLYIAQPPLSVQIRALEEELEVQLLERDNRRVFLTQAGHQFLRRTRVILHNVDSAKAEARRVASETNGCLAIGYSASVMLSTVLTTALQRFRDACPHVPLTLQEMSSAEQMAALSERALDIGILRQQDIPGSDDQVEIEEWHRSLLVAVVPGAHRLSAGPIRMTDLRNEPLIVFPEALGVGLLAKLQDLCNKAGFTPKQAHKTLDTMSTIGLVAAGAGIALLPEHVRCVQIPGVVFQPVLDEDAASTFWLARQKSDPRRLSAKLFDMLRSECAKCCPRQH